ncbi:gamma carbonic anhydrase family protein [Mesorhizobium sp. CO1-1-8]|uniref:gamma carbonic anhydrase family protein n=1 Tax=Mesorhizobium sp. CO1-1-8 TaxID=2876631 RepID=UPI001CD1783C|nr:hypothetical protein [Mesorhizobium sp. CO1-1-8]MBZ9772203.1 hypothetical protein [Mesorhizobium sp. CO1-1-8]
MGSTIWFNAVLRGNFGPISIDRNTNIQDAVIIRSDEGKSVTIGATVLDGAVIGPEKMVEAGTMWVGSPAKKVRHLSPGEVRSLQGRHGALPGQGILPVGPRRLRKDYFPSRITRRQGAAFFDSAPA